MKKSSNNKNAGKSIKTKTVAKVVIKMLQRSRKAKKTASKFFKNSVRSKEKIYTSDNQHKNATFTENKVFSSTYFYKTHIHWNSLPYEIINIDEYDVFQAKLEQYLWDSILNEGIPTNLETSFEVPGD